MISAKLVMVTILSLVVPQIALAFEATAQMKAESKPLVCDIANAIVKQYPSTPNLQNSTESAFNAELSQAMQKAYTLQAAFPAHFIDYSSSNWRLQDFYDQYVSNGLEYYLYPAMIRETNVKTQSSDFMLKFMYFETVVQSATSRVDFLKMAEDPNALIKQIEATEIPKEFLAFFHWGQYEAMLWHTGDKTEQFTRELLSHPYASLGYRDLLRIALKITNGDVLSAVGVIGLSLGLDASANRNRGALLSSKIVPMIYVPEDEEAKVKHFNFQPGFNYHFWCYLGEAWMRTPAWLWARSYVYEDLIQKDPQEGYADKTAIATANAVQRLVANPERIPQVCGQ